MSRFEQTAKLPIVKVLVIESRKLSLLLAEQLGVPHASPQMILVKEGQAIWDASHYKIAVDTLQKEEQRTTE